MGRPEKGLYRVYTATFGETTLQITAYDEMIYFDRPYSECTLSYPATIRDIVLDACRHCQVDCESSSIEMGNYIVKTKPEGSITYRDVISYCAQIMGCYARINHLGRLAFGWYDFSAVGSGDLDGGILIPHHRKNICPVMKLAAEHLTITVPDIHTMVAHLSTWTLIIISTICTTSR